MPTNYQRGRQFEYRTKAKLLKMGAVYVMRAASSKGAADLIALWPTTENPVYGEGRYTLKPPWMVQTKYSINGKAYLASLERENLKEIADRAGAIPVFARPGKNGRGVEFINLLTEEPLGI